MYSECDSRKPAIAGEFIIEVIGADGLRHHVGPFRQREDAENWLAQNPSESEPDTPTGSHATDERAGNHGRRLSD